MGSVPFRGERDDIKNYICEIIHGQSIPKEYKEEKYYLQLKELRTLRGKLSDGGMSDLTNTLLKQKETICLPSKEGNIGKGGKYISIYFSHVCFS